MSLVIRKQHPDETWREAAERYAVKYGLEVEVLGLFDEAVTKGTPPALAAWDACYEWDLLDCEEDPPTSPTLLQRVQRFFRDLFRPTLPPATLPADSAPTPVQPKPEGM